MILEGCAVRMQGPSRAMLTLFEQGIALTRECHEKLDAADQKIVELTRDLDEQAS